MVAEPIPGRAGDALALVAGLALPLAFAPFGLFPLAPAALGVLFLTWLGAPPRRALLRGWLFGLGAFGFGVSWIHESFQFSHVPLVYAVICTAGLVAFLAVYPALAGYAARRLSPAGDALALVLVMPATWMLAEWLRGWVFTGFTWLQLGYSQLDSPLAGLFPVTGVYGAGWALAVSAGLLALVFHRRARGWWRWVGGGVVLWGAAASLGPVPWTEPAGEALRVALVQGNVPQDQKWRPAMREPTLERYLGHTGRHWDADVVVWPETALPGLYRDMTEFVALLEAQARARGTDVLFGVPVYDEEADAFLNSVFVVGQSQGAYHKRHLVPFGEYLPLEAALRPVTEALGIPVADFSPGPREQRLPRLGGQPVGVSVCYEIAFGAEVARALPEARLLVTVSNDAWFGESIGPHQHMEIARARALETGRFLLRATNTGITAIVDPRGAIVARAPQFEEHVLSGRVSPRRGATPYVRLGDAPVVVALALALIAAAALSRRRSPGGAGPA